MALYASICPVCETVEFRVWGSTRCSKCGAKMIQSKVEQFKYESLSDAEKEDVFPEIKMRKAQSLKEKELENARMIKELEEFRKLESIQLLTADSIEGHEIDKYHGIIGGVGFYSIEGLLDGGLFGDQPTEQYQNALDEAMRAMRKNAAKINPVPDAVIGIRTNVFMVPSIGVQVNLTGTAVSFKK